MALIVNTINPDSAFLGGHVKDRSNKFKEYPKMVYPNGWDATHPERGGKLVLSPEEEAEVMGEKFEPSLQVAPYQPKAIPAAAIIPPDTGERKFLVAMLEKLGEKFDPEAPIIELRTKLEGLAAAPEPEVKEPAEDAPAEVETTAGG